MERKSRWRLRVLLNWLFLWLFVNFFCYFLLPSLVFFLAYHHSCVDNIFSIQSTFLRYTYILSTELMVSFCLYEEDRALTLVWLTLRQCKIERIIEKKKKKSLWFRHFVRSTSFRWLPVIIRHRSIQNLSNGLHRNPGYSSGIHGVTYMQIRKYNPIWFYI